MTIEEVQERRDRINEALRAAEDPPWDYSEVDELRADLNEDVIQAIAWGDISDSQAQLACEIACGATVR